MTADKGTHMMYIYREILWLLQMNNNNTNNNHNHHHNEEMLSTVTITATATAKARATKNVNATVEKTVFTFKTTTKTEHTSCLIVGKERNNKLNFGQSTRVASYNFISHNKVIIYISCIQVFELYRFDHAKLFK